MLQVFCSANTSSDRLIRMNSINCPKMTSRFLLPGCISSSSFVLSASNLASKLERFASNTLIIFSRWMSNYATLPIGSTRILAQFSRLLLRGWGWDIFTICIRCSLRFFRIFSRSTSLCDIYPLILRLRRNSPLIMNIVWPANLLLVRWLNLEAPQLYMWSIIRDVRKV